MEYTLAWHVLRTAPVSRDAAAIEAPDQASVAGILTTGVCYGYVASSSTPASRLGYHSWFPCVYDTGLDPHGLQSERSAHQHLRSGSVLDSSEPLGVQEAVPRRVLLAHARPLEEDAQPLITLAHIYSTQSSQLGTCERPLCIVSTTRREQADGLPMH